MKIERGSPAYIRDTLRKGFVKAVGGCNIQDGWPCRTCFFFALGQVGITGDDAHALWTVQLLLRDDGQERGYVITCTPTPEQAAHEERARLWRERS